VTVVGGSGFTGSSKSGGGCLGGGGGCFGCGLDARDTITSETGLTCARESSVGIRAGGLSMAVVCLGFAFVAVLTGSSVSMEVLEVVGSSSALAVEASDSVGASGIGVTIAITVGTLVNIFAAFFSVSGESGFARAREATWGVVTVGVLVAVVGVALAFVDVLACFAVSLESGVTFARESSLRVGACCVGVAVVSSSCTFVDIVARDSISFESGLAFAFESSVGVAA
jgi:hypothetical protein